MNQSTAPRLRFQISRLRKGDTCQPELGLDAILPEATVQQVLKVIDGTTVSMPDTPANQTGYPQMPRQKPGWSSQAKMHGEPT